MPRYAYKGIECPHEFEVHQSFADDPLTTCITCGLPVRRVIQPTGVIFKGSGWYINDSRPAAKDSDTSKDTSDSKPATTKTESAKNGAAASSKTDDSTKKSSTTQSTG